MFEWMYWAPQTLSVILGLFLVLLIMAILDVKKPSTPRKGLLPIPTTRGDRLFIGIMFCIVIGLMWVAFIGYIYPEILLIIQAIVFIIIFKFG
jgi:predicted small integral membrane protein